MYMDNQRDASRVPSDEFSPLSPAGVGMGDRGDPPVIRNS